MKGPSREGRGDKSCYPIISATVRRSWSGERGKPGSLTSDIAARGLERKRGRKSLGRRFGLAVDIVMT
jgi:hypothetical protein